MVTNSQIRKRLAARPFRPFRFVMKSGESYDVFRPDFVMVLTTSVAIGYPPGDDLPDAFHLVNVCDIGELVQIPALAKYSSKGAKAGKPREFGLDKDTIDDLSREFPPLRELLPCLRDE